MRILEKVRLSLPPVTYSDTAMHGLSAADKVLLDAYFTQVRLFWLNAEYVPTAVTVDISVDAEENVRTVVVAHSLDAEPDDALRYWDSIGEELDNWTSHEHGGVAKEVLDLISTNVLWRE